MERIEKLAGIAGLVLGAMMIVSFVLDLAVMATTGGPPVIRLSAIPSDLVRARSSVIWPITLWNYSLMMVPVAVFVLGLRRALGAAGQTAVADLAAASAILSFVFHTLHNLAFVTVVQVLAPAYVPGAADGAAIEAATRGLLGLSYASYLPGEGIGGVLMVVALLAFASAQQRSRMRVRPALALAGGVLMGTGGTIEWGLAGHPSAESMDLFLAATLLGWVLFIVWTLLTAVGLLRLVEARAKALAAQRA